MSAEIVKNLKGGSLSGTNVVSTGGGLAVRKSIPATEHREFGFYRWFSQYKRLQRYQPLAGDLFPKLLASGTSGDSYYFDIEYFPEGRNCYDLLSEERDPAEVGRIFRKIVGAMEGLNAHRYPALAGGLEIYYSEEVEMRLGAFAAAEGTREFYAQDEYYFNGERVESLKGKIADFFADTLRDFSPSHECYTHGNITLENILYDPPSDRIIFIDPYEENFLDCEHLEYSQLLQSSNACYEQLNAADFTLDGNRLEVADQPPEGIRRFNELLLSHMRERFTTGERGLIRFFEISQFIRMLPFKAVVDPERGKLFYLLACKLLQQNCDYV